MKLGFFLFGFFGLLACNGEISNEDMNEKNIEVQDVSKQLLQENDTIEHIALSYVPERLKELLLRPIDLPAYKKVYGPSNSGGGMDEDLFDIPDTSGFMYRYMLFSKLKQVLTSHPSEAELFEKFRIHVYMYGTNVGNFKENNEELIAIECALDNNTLGDLNVYGLSREKVREKFGKPQIEMQEHYIYNVNNNVLSIHFDLENQTADWFKYARMNKEICLAKEPPAYLLHF